MPDAIGFVLKGYPRLSEAFIAQEILGLERRGFAVEIFSMRGPREELRHPFVGEIRAKVNYLPRGRALLASNARAALRFPFGYLKALLHAVRRRSWETLARFLDAGWLADEASAVAHLHAHFIHAPAELAFYAGRIAGRDFSVTAHARDIYTSAPEDLARRAKAARFVLTCTAANRDYLARVAGVPEGKVRLAYHGVDLSAFVPGEAGDPRRLVSVGRLVPKKGFDQALWALSLLRARGEEFEWDLYGAGALEGELRGLAERLRLSPRVRFHGHAARPRIIERLRNGGIYICASVETEDGDRDGLPNALLEAMAMGLPVVATAVSGIPEAVRHGVDGLLVPQRDPAALAEAVTTLLKDPALARRLSASARARVESLFNAEACLDSCARHFAQALPAPGVAGAGVPPPLPIGSGLP